MDRKNSALPQPLGAVLDMARWAPSGDNSQPWRFQVHDPLNFTVHGFDTRDFCVYDLDGHASQISLGALLESIELAAGLHGLGAVCELREGCGDRTPIIDVRMQPTEAAADPLAAAIPGRCTHRGLYRPRALDEERLGFLRRALPEGYDLRWLRSPRRRLRGARLLFRSAWIRLATPECHAVHRRVIARGVRFSSDRLPDASLGLDPVTRRLMHWGFGSWTRARALNRWLPGATVMPRLQMEWAPGLMCGAQLLLCAPEPPGSLADYLRAGRAVQRLWLAASCVGLQFQPLLTPLIFARYARQGLRFCGDARAMARAGETDRNFGGLFGRQNWLRGVFMARVGDGPSPGSRSLRRPLAELMWTG